MSNVEAAYPLPPCIISLVHHHFVHLDALKVIRVLGGDAHVWVVGHRREPQTLEARGGREDTSMDDEFWAAYTPLHHITHQAREEHTPW